MFDDQCIFIVFFSFSIFQNQIKYRLGNLFMTDSTLITSLPWIIASNILICHQNRMVFFIIIQICLPTKLLNLVNVSIAV